MGLRPQIISISSSLQTNVGEFYIVLPPCQSSLLSNGKQILPYPIQIWNGRGRILGIGKRGLPPQQSKNRLCRRTKQPKDSRWNCQNVLYALQVGFFQRIHPKNLTIWWGAAGNMTETDESPLSNATQWYNNMLGPYINQYISCRELELIVVDPDEPFRRWKNKTQHVLRWYVDKQIGKWGTLDQYSPGWQKNQTLG